MVPVRTELPDYVAGSANSVITVSYAGLTTTTTNGTRAREGVRPSQLFVFVQFACRF